MRRRRVVLLVHSDDDRRLTFQVVLKREGYEVLEARAAADALEQIGEVMPDLLIVDVDARLARQSGLTLIRTIRSQDDYRTIRILAVSNRATVTTPAGADAFHAGTITPDQLVKAVAELIGRA